MKVGDLIMVLDVMPGVHPVGLVIKIEEDSAMVLYQDGDYEELEFDTGVEVLRDTL